MFNVAPQYLIMIYLDLVDLSREFIWGYKKKVLSLI
jgi:hypothetical protein